MSLDGPPGSLIRGAAATVRGHGRGRGVVGRASVTSTTRITARAAAGAATSGGTGAGGPLSLSLAGLPLPLPLIGAGDGRRELSSAALHGLESLLHGIQVPLAGLIFQLIEELVDRLSGRNLHIMVGLSLLDDGLKSLMNRHLLSPFGLLVLLNDLQASHDQVKLAGEILLQCIDTTGEIRWTDDDP